MNDNKKKMGVVEGIVIIVLGLGGMLTALVFGQMAIDAQRQSHSEGLALVAIIVIIVGYIVVDVVEKYATKSQDKKNDD